MENIHQRILLHSTLVLAVFPRYQELLFFLFYFCKQFLQMVTLAKGILRCFHKQVHQQYFGTLVQVLSSFRDGHNILHLMKWAVLMTANDSWLVNDFSIKVDIPSKCCNKIGFCSCLAVRSCLFGFLNGKSGSKNGGIAAPHFRNLPEWGAVYHM